MQKKPVKKPKSRNNAAHASLQSYYDRIATSLEDRVADFVQMRKYIRVYEEAQKLLEIEKTLNIAAGSIYEISLGNKLAYCESLEGLGKQLVEKNRKLKKSLNGHATQKHNQQHKLLRYTIVHLDKIVNNIHDIHNHVSRIHEVVPVIKALLKMKDRDDHDEGADPLLLQICDALQHSLIEPDLDDIKAILKKEHREVVQQDCRLNYEHMNDVSDKLIGLLNEKLLLVIGVSEYLIAGIDDDGANDVPADERLPDELRVLFLAANTLDVLNRIKAMRLILKDILNSVKTCLKIIEGNNLDNTYKAMLSNGEDNVRQLLSNALVSYLKLIKPPISETAPGLDALELKLKLDTLDLDTVIRMTYGLIYEKANRTWENPYETRHN